MNFIINNWTENNYKNLISYLKLNQSENYRNYSFKLIPDLPKERIIGNSIPFLRKVGKEISKGNFESFLEISGNYYYEEIILNGIVLSLIKTKSYNQLLKILDCHSQYINNWATCDTFCCSLKEIKNYRPEFLEKINEYINSENPWYIRIGIVILLNYYLDDEYILNSLHIIDKIDSDFYYVSMAQAWLIATAFSKNPEITMDYFISCNLNTETYNRAIQKSIESFRISTDLKDKLKLLRKTKN